MSTQAIAITEDGDRASQLWAARKAAGVFRLSPTAVDHVIDAVVSGTRAHFDEAAESVGLTRAERDALRGREILNDDIFSDAP